MLTVMFIDCLMFTDGGKVMLCLMQIVASFVMVASYPVLVVDCSVLCIELDGYTHYTGNSYVTYIRR